MSEKWDRRFMRLAMDVARWSKDPRKGVGALVVSPCRRRFSIGYNGFPKGVEDRVERLKDDEARLALTVHAELNALLNCTFDPEGCTLYATQFPCLDCAKAVVQRRIARVVAPTWSHRSDSKWLSSWSMAEAVMTEAGVRADLFHFGALEDHMFNPIGEE